MSNSMSQTSYKYIFTGRRQRKYKTGIENCNENKLSSKLLSFTQYITKLIVPRKKNYLIKLTLKLP